MRPAVLEAVVRFVTLLQEGEEGPEPVLISRIEGLRSCPHCGRSHPYQVGLIGPDDEVLAADELFDSWEDAAAQVREWLPDGLRFLGHREPELDEDATEVFFDTQSAAIAWLLEPIA